MTDFTETTTAPEETGTTLQTAEAAIIAQTPTLELDDADRTTLTLEEEAKVTALIPKIDIADEDVVASYGGDAMEEIRRVAESAVGNARVKDIEDVSRLIIGVDSEMNEFKAFVLAKKFARNIKKELEKLYKRFQPIEKYVNKIETELERYILVFGRDIAIDNQRYEANQAASRKLLIYIKAGRAALKNAREITLVELEAKASETESRDDVQAAARFKDQCDSFELHLVDLDKSRTIAFLRGPQIEMQKKAKRSMETTLKSMRDHAIPTLFDTMASLLGQSHLKRGILLADKTRATTSDLLKLNADLVGQSAIDAEKARGAGFVDTEAIIYAVNKYIEDSQAVKNVVQENLINARSTVKELENIKSQLADSFR